MNISKKNQGHSIKNKYVVSITRLTFTLMILFGLSFTNGHAQVDLINDEFPEAQQEVLKTWDSIVQSLRDGDMDKLIAFHGYSPKFTEFKDGAPRNGGEANELFERNTFSAVTEIVKFDVNDMQIAVYGDVANMTMHTDFHLKFGENLVIVKEQMSILFVKTDNGWKIVHEHHSSLKDEGK